MWPLEPKHTSDTLETVQHRLDAGEAVLWDVREQDEWDTGHLQAATLVPLSVLSNEFREGALAARLGRQLPAGKTVYCHCGSGVRVLTATKILKALGCDVRPLKAGYKTLRKAGFEPAGS